MGITYKSDTGILIATNAVGSVKAGFVSTQPGATDLVVAGGALHGTGTAWTPVVSDDQGGGAYQLDVVKGTDGTTGPITDGKSAAVLASRGNVSLNSPTFSVAFESAGSINTAIAAMGVCYANAAVVGWFDVATSNSASGSLSMMLTGSTANTSQGDEVAVTSLAVDNGANVSPLTVSGFTVRGSSPDGTNNAVGGIADLILTVIGPQAATWTYGIPSGAAGDTHAAAIATYRGINRPVITLQATDATVEIGASATFIAAATASSGAVTYQWQDNSTGVYANIVGATGATYRTGPTTGDMNGRRYRPTFTDSNGTVLGTSVTLRVNVAVQVPSYIQPRTTRQPGPFAILDARGWFLPDLRTTKWWDDLLDDAQGGQTTTINCTVGNAVEAGIACKVVQVTNINCTVGGATAAGVACRVAQTTTVRGTVGNAVAAGVACRVAQTTTIACTVGHATAAGVPCRVAQTTNVACTVGTAVAAGRACAVVQPTVIACSPGGATAAGVHCAVIQTAVIPCTIGTAHADGIACRVVQTTVVPCSAGSAHADGVACKVVQTTTISCSPGNAVAAGVQCRVAQTTVIGCTVGQAHADGVHCAVVVDNSTAVDCRTGAATAAGVPCAVISTTAIACRAGNATAAGVSCRVQQVTRVACSPGSASASGVPCRVAQTTVIACSTGAAHADGVPCAIAAQTPTTISCEIGDAAAMGVACQIDATAPTPPTPIQAPGGGGGPGPLPRRRRAIRLALTDAVDERLVTQLRSQAVIRPMARTIATIAQQAEDAVRAVQRGHFLRPRTSVEMVEMVLDKAAGRMQTEDVDLQRLHDLLMAEDT